MRQALPAVALALALTLTACGGDEPAPSGDDDRVVLTPPSEGADHTHAPGQEHGGAPLGDGSKDRAGGYAMTDVKLPGTDGPGQMSFRIVDAKGKPLTAYTEEQTKLLHLYVVRADLKTFRHLHPTLDKSGTWRTQVDLGEPGPWRVVAEFQPEGAAQAIVLGSEVDVPGKWKPTAAPRGEDAATADDGVIRVELLQPGRVSENGRIKILITDLDGRPVDLGSYLGASAHVTGFQINDSSDNKTASGGFVHVHPYGAPEITDDGTVLTFHTTFTKPGDYRTFVQVRVGGLLHQIPITVPVSAAE